MGRPGVDGGAGRPPGARCANLGLRGAPRLVDAGARGGRLAHLRRPRSAAGRLRGRDGLHARGAAAGGRAPARRVLGLRHPRLLRTDEPLRHAAGVHGARRHPPPARNRSPRRLVGRPLPEGRARAGPLRRHPPLRARGPAAARPPALGLRDLQLRPARGAQLPDRQRALLVRGVPRRRAARRCGGLDALPGLRAGRRRVGAEPARGQGESRRRPFPAAAERAGLRGAPPAS